MSVTAPFILIMADILASGPRAMVRARLLAMAARSGSKQKPKNRSTPFTRQDAPMADAVRASPANAMARPAIITAPIFAIRLEIKSAPSGRINRFRALARD